MASIQTFPLPTIPDIRLRCCCVLDPCPVNHCSHSIFLWKDKVLRPSVEPALTNRSFNVSPVCLERTEVAVPRLDSGRGFSTHSCHFIKIPERQLSSEADIYTKLVLIDFSHFLKYFSILQLCCWGNVIHFNTQQSRLMF